MQEITVLGDGITGTGNAESSSQSSPLEITITREMIEAFTIATKDDNPIHYGSNATALAMQILWLIDNSCLTAQLKCKAEYIKYSSFRFRVPIEAGKKITISRSNIPERDNARSNIPERDDDNSLYKIVISGQGRKRGDIEFCSGTIERANQFFELSSTVTESDFQLQLVEEHNAILTTGPNVRILKLTKDSIETLYNGIGVGYNDQQSVPAIYVFGLISGILQARYTDKFNDGANYKYTGIDVTLSTTPIKINDLPKVKFFLDSFTESPQGAGKDLLTFNAGARLEDKVVYSARLSILRTEKREAA